jgi:phage gpG-like protein
MAKLEVKIKGIREAYKKIDGQRIALLKEVGQAALETGYDIEATAKELVRVDTGRLRSSINTSFRKVGAKVIEVSVGTNVNYANAQEFGDPARPNYGYTPFLFPAYEQHKNGFLKAVQALFKKRK